MKTIYEIVVECFTLEMCLHYISLMENDSADQFAEGRSVEELRKYIAVDMETSIQTFSSYCLDVVLNNDRVAIEAINGHQNKHPHVFDAIRKQMDQ